MIDFFALWDSPEDLRFLRLFRNADFDPLTAIAIAGSAASAAGTLMGGFAANKMGQMQQTAADFQAEQDRMNSASEIAGAQRKAFDTGMKARLVQSRAIAGAAAGGLTTTTGSPLETEAEIGERGQYAASLDLWNGQNAATGDLNKAAAAHYTGQMDRIGGQMAQEGSYFSAAGTLASGGASAYSKYQKSMNPSLYGFSDSPGYG